MTTLREESLTWQFDANDTYVPITRNGKTVGFFKPNHAHRIVEMLNETDKLQKAMKLACAELLRQTGQDPVNVDAAVKHFIAQVERPKAGTGAIAALLRDRQDELDVNEDEFVRFCETYRLSKDKLNDIFAGEGVPDRLLGPLARILGITVERLIEIRDRK